MNTGVSTVLIGDGANTGTTLPGIKKGDLLIIKEDGTVISTKAQAEALSKADRIYIAQGIADGEARLSAPIQGNTVSKYEGQNYVAPVLGSVTVGAIEADENIEYRLRILIKDQQRIGQRPTIVDCIEKAISGETFASLASKIAIQFYTKEYGRNFISNYIRLDRTCTVTETDFANAITVVQNSKDVSCTSHGLSAGDSVVIKGILYLIDSVTTNAFVLDIPYQGVSETIATSVANTGSKATSDSNIAAVKFVLTAKTQTSLGSKAVNYPIDGYEWVVFDAGFATTANQAKSGVPYEFIAAEVRVETNPGQGYWKQVADAEHKMKGYLGVVNNRNYYHQVPENSVVVDETYGSISITHAQIVPGDFQDTYRTPVSTVIYVPNGTAQATATATSAAAQVETATVVATITEPGDVAVTITSALISGSPVTYNVPVADNADASAVALAIRTALNAEAAITEHYTVSGATDKVILTAKVEAANDSTLNIATATGTATGLTPDATSANTTAGSAGTANFLQIINGYFGTVCGFAEISTMS